MKGHEKKLEEMKLRRRAGRDEDVGMMAIGAVADAHRGVNGLDSRFRGGLHPFFELGETHRIAKLQPVPASGMIERLCRHIVGAM